MIVGGGKSLCFQGKKARSVLAHFRSSCSSTSRGDHSCVSIDWYAMQLIAFSTFLTICSAHGTATPSAPCNTDFCSKIKLMH